MVVTPAGIGHNGGPEMSGVAWRTHCWKTARETLLPTLPIEVVRLRVRRAQELGLEYKTYAGIRATTGRDLIAFLFSSNALGLHRGRDLTGQVQDRLTRMKQVGKIGLSVAPLTPDQLLTLAPMLDQSHPAPRPFAEFAEARQVLRAATGAIPSDAVLLIGSHGGEADWCATARFAGYLSADRFFAA